MARARVQARGQLPRGTSARVSDKPRMRCCAERRGEAWGRWFLADSWRPQARTGSCSRRCVRTLLPQQALPGRSKEGACKAANVALGKAETKAVPERPQTSGDLCLPVLQDCVYLTNRQSWHRRHRLHSKPLMHTPQVAPACNRTEVCCQQQMCCPPVHSCPLTQRPHKPSEQRCLL